MCSVSVVSQYYTDTYPNRMNPQNPFMSPQPNPYMPMGPVGGSQQTAVHTFDAETKQLMRQALILLDKIDKRLGDVECMDDAKAAFLKTLNLNPDDIGA